jgi:para-nitrobenzyl esterase
MTGDPAVLTIAALELLAAAGIAVFWVTWFHEDHDQAWLPAGYVQHERAFVFPDALLAMLLVVSATLLVAEDPLGRTLSLVCAGMLAFLGVLDAAYFWHTDLFARERGGLVNAAVVSGVLTLAAVLLVFFGLTGPVATETGLSVGTESGLVHGVSEPGVRVFRGIPYAAPPAGSLRWRPPQPPEHWEGVRAAETFGASCPQPGAPEPMTEDCLTLNVWTPDGATAATPLPVMVWIHGGGFRSGSGSDAVSHGEVLAREGVVVVTLNYRLGALGFLAHPLLERNDEAWANYGILDMVAALEWVQRNIASFGGDPSRVTVFGESAGGMAIHLLMVVPRAEGLFHRAIGLSGYGTWPLPRVRSAASAGARTGAPSAEEIAEAIVGRATRDGPAPETATQLRRVPAVRLAEAVEGLHLPVVDGEVVPDEPGTLFARGAQHDVPFMTGGDSFDGAVMPWSGIPTDEFLDSWGSDLDRLRTLYADDFAVSDQLGANRLFGDARYVMAGRYLAEQMAQVSSPGYLYYFTFVPAAQRSEGPGAPHGSELGLLFGHAEDTDAVGLGQTMRAYWTAFARTGDPNGPGRPEWPVYTGRADEWLVIGETPEVETAVLEDKLDFLEARYLERVGASGP